MTLKASDIGWLADVFEDNGWTWASGGKVRVPTEEEILTTANSLMSRVKQLPVGHSIGTGRLEATNGEEGVTLSLWVADEWDE